MTNLLWLVLKTTAKDLLGFRHAAIEIAIELGQGRQLRSNASVTCGNRFLSQKSKIAPSRIATQSPPTRGSGKRGPQRGRDGAARAAPFSISVVLFVRFAGAARE
jgi:hypothetical protein